MRRLQFPRGPRRQQRRGSGGAQPRDAAAAPVRDLAAAPVRDAAAARATRSPTWMAELTLPAAELRRLRHAAIRIKYKTKVGGAGLTREVMEKIKEKWKTEEVVRVKVSGTPALNMRLFHEILEVHSDSATIVPFYQPSLYIGCSVENCTDRYLKVYANLFYLHSHSLHCYLGSL